MTAGALLGHVVKSAEQHCLSTMLALLVLAGSFYAADRRRVVRCESLSSWDSGADMLLELVTLGVCGAMGIARQRASTRGG